MNAQELEKNKILVLSVGSHLYGTNTPTSDLDYSGIFIPSEEYVYGFQKVEEINLGFVSKREDGKNESDAIDYKLYELRKFLMLAKDNNPNILEMLFVNDANVKFINEYGKFILSKAGLFPHKGLKQKFLGYAFSQKHKMVIRTDKFHDLENGLAVLDGINPKLYLAELKHQCLTLVGKCNDKFWQIGDISIQLNVNVKKAVEQLTERLAKVGNRKELYLKHAYDTKFASHLVRLMYEGLELLETGTISFPLKQKDLILAIKNGQYTIKEVLEMSDELEAKVEAMAEKSDLPEKPRQEEIQNMCMIILKEFLK